MVPPVPQFGERYFCDYPLVNSRDDSLFMRSRARNSNKSITELENSFSETTWPERIDYRRPIDAASNWRHGAVQDRCIAGCKEGDSVRGTRIVKINESATSWESSGCRPAFDSCVRPVPEIPAVVIDAHGCDFLRRKRDFLVSSDLDDAALAGNNLVEMPAVPEVD